MLGAWDLRSHEQLLKRIHHAPDLISMETCGHIFVYTDICTLYALTSNRRTADLANRSVCYRGAPSSNSKLCFKLRLWRLFGEFRCESNADSRDRYRHQTK